MRKIIWILIILETISIFIWFTTFSLGSAVTVLIVGYLLIQQLTTNNIKKWLYWVLALIILIPMILIGIKHNKNSESVSDINSIPDTYTKLYTLKKGEVVRVYIPTWYKADCTGGGKKYYHQDQKGPKEIWGDGTFHQGSTHTAFFDLSYYNEEITVVVEFKRLR